MTFHIRREVPDLKPSLNNKDIDQVNTFSFLGILVDSDLCWKNHINMIRLKISRLIGILHRVKRFLPKTISITIYRSVIMPHFNYGLLLWGPHLGRLVTLQKKTIRVVSLSDYLSHTDPIFNPIRSGLFQTVNDPGGGALKAHPPPYDLENDCVNLHHIIHVNFTRCFWHDPIGIFQKFAILTILQRFQNKK